MPEIHQAEQAGLDINELNRDLNNEGKLLTQLEEKRKIRVSEKLKSIPELRKSQEKATQDLDKINEALADYGTDVKVDKMDELDKAHYLELQSKAEKFLSIIKKIDEELDKAQQDPIVLGEMKDNAKNMNEKIDKVMELKKELDTVIEQSLNTINEIAEASAKQEKAYLKLKPQHDNLVGNLKSKIQGIGEHYKNYLSELSTAKDLKSFAARLNEGHKDKGMLSKITGTLEKKILGLPEFKQLQDFYETNGEMNDGEDIIRSQENIKKIDAIPSSIMEVRDKFGEKFSGEVLQAAKIDYEYIMKNFDEDLIKENKDRTKSDYWKKWAFKWVDRGFDKKVHKFHNALL